MIFINVLNFDSKIKMSWRDQLKRKKHERNHPKSINQALKMSVKVKWEIPNTNFETIVK